MNNTDTFSQPSLIIFTKGADIFGHNCIYYFYYNSITDIQITPHLKLTLIILLIKTLLNVWFTFSIKCLIFGFNVLFFIYVHKIA